MLVLFAVPFVLISLAWKRGCRADERSAVRAIAALSAVLFWPAFVWALSAHTRLAAAFAYALVSVTMACVAMLLRERPEPDGGGGPPPEAEAPPAPSFDWKDFERRFWRDVQRRRRDRVGV